MEKTQILCVIDLPGRVLPSLNEGNQKNGITRVMLLPGCNAVEVMHYVGQSRGSVLWHPFLQQLHNFNEINAYHKNLRDQNPSEL